MRVRIQFVVLGVLLLAGCKTKVQQEEAIRPVFYHEVGKTTTPDTRKFSGVAQSASEAKLSFKVGGMIEQLPAEMGDTLNRGAVIARLDATDYRIRLHQAEASLKNAKAQLAAAQSAFLRMEKLYVNNNASLSDYEKVKVQYESAEMMVKSVRSQLDAAQNQLDYTELRAPFDGRISSVLARENEMAGVGHPVVTFAALNDLEVKTAVPENIITEINRRADVRVEFSAFPGHFFQGIITEVSPGMPEASVYPVIIQLTDSDPRIFSGMTCTVELPLNGKDHAELNFMVTTDAVGHDHTGDFVYVAGHGDAEGIYVAEKRAVTLGELRAGGYEIVQGLQKEEIVITAGLSFLYDGRKVKLIGEEK